MVPFRNLYFFWGNSAFAALWRDLLCFTLCVDAVAGVSLAVPSVAVEGNNVTLSCTWTSGTEITVQWGKGGATITTDSRITISGGSLVINPARRSDAGDYTCTVSNPVSARTATQSLTVYCEYALIEVVANLL